MDTAVINGIEADIDENGKVRGAWINGTYRWPYVAKNGHWENATGRLTPAAVRARIKRGTFAWN